MRLHCSVCVMRLLQVMDLTYGSRSLKFLFFFFLRLYLWWCIQVFLLWLYYGVGIDISSSFLLYVLIIHMKYLCWMIFFLLSPNTFSAIILLKFFQRYTTIILREGYIFFSWMLDTSLFTLNFYFYFFVSTYKFSFFIFPLPCKFLLIINSILTLTLI